MMSHMTRRTVIVVDDHAAFRRQAVRLLEAAGFEVVGEAADGAGALALADQVHPDAAMLDVGLPDRSGFDVARALPTDLDVLLVSSDADALMLADEHERPFLRKDELTPAALAGALGRA